MSRVNYDSRTLDYCNHISNDTSPAGYSATDDTKVSQTYTLEEIEVTPYLISSNFRSICNNSLVNLGSYSPYNYFSFYVSDDILIPLLDNTISASGESFNGPRGFIAWIPKSHFNFKSDEGEFICNWITNDEFDSKYTPNSYVELNSITCKTTTYNCEFDLNTREIKVPQNNSGSERVVYIRFEYLIDSTLNENLYNRELVHMYFYVGKQQA